MKTVHLNEHDANQGAQSSGEFLGMSGNSGWYLLGSGGMTILMVIVLWGIFGVPLLLCLFAGIILCLLSVAYVFTLKNNRPEHYDTDFFESVFVEAGVLRFRFGPRTLRPANPFTNGDPGARVAGVKERGGAPRSAPTGNKGQSTGSQWPAVQVKRDDPLSTKGPKENEPMVPRVVYEQLHDKLITTEELLEDALAETSEN